MQQVLRWLLRLTMLLQEQSRHTLQCVSCLTRGDGKYSTAVCVLTFETWLRVVCLPVYTYGSTCDWARDSSLLYDVRVSVCVQ